MQERSLEIMRRKIIKIIAMLTILVYAQTALPVFASGTPAWLKTLEEKVDKSEVVAENTELKEWREKKRTTKVPIPMPTGRASEEISPSVILIPNWSMKYSGTHVTRP